MEEHTLNLAIQKFLLWKKNYPRSSYDRMDYWSSAAGILAKKLFYNNKVIGAPLALAGLLLENYFPNAQKLFAKPHVECIGDAHYALGFLNLYELEGDRRNLQEAEEHLQNLERTATSGYSGKAWGYTFGWQTQRGYWAPGIPLITITPYVFWAFKKHFEITGDLASRDMCFSIAKFAFSDLNQTPMEGGTRASSYSPTTNDIVINANTYRAALLLDAFEMFKIEEYKLSALEDIDFVLHYQGRDGEWYYEAKSDKNNFIDNFHTCFVLRNLFKCFEATKDERILSAIKKGYRFYQKNLIDSKGLPIHFAKAKYIKLRKFEIYDFAEGVSLGLLLKDVVPNATDIVDKLASELLDEYQLTDGHFVTRVASLGVRHTVPYHRWPQSQIFFALTNYLKHLRCSE